MKKLRLLAAKMYSGTQHFDEIIENIDGKDDIRDKTIKQIDNKGMEDAEMKSFGEKNTLKQSDNQFKMTIRPPGISIYQQRDPVLDDFESVIENLQNKMGPDFDNTCVVFTQGIRNNTTWIIATTAVAAEIKKQHRYNVSKNTFYQWSARISCHYTVHSQI